MPANGHKAATSDEQQIRAWIEQYPGCNWGTTFRDGFVGLDFDPRNGSEETWAEISEGRRLPLGPRVLTPSGGLHAYFAGRVVRHGADALGPGIDIKAYVGGRAGYFVLPGSRTVKGAYELLRGGFDAPPPLPDWLHPKPKRPVKSKSAVTMALRGRDYVVKALRDECMTAAGLRDGQHRRDNLFQAGLKLAKFVPPLLESEIAAALTAAGIRSGLDEGEASSHVLNGLTTGLEQRL